MFLHRIRLNLHTSNRCCSPGSMRRTTKRRLMNPSQRSSRSNAHSASQAWKLADKLHHPQGQLIKPFPASCLQYAPVFLIKICLLRMKRKKDPCSSMFKRAYHDCIQWFCKKRLLSIWSLEWLQPSEDIIMTWVAFSHMHAWTCHACMHSPFSATFMPIDSTLHLLFWLNFWHTVLHHLPKFIVLHVQRMHTWFCCLFGRLTYSYTCIQARTSTCETTCESSSENACVSS